MPYTPFSWLGRLGLDEILVQGLGSSGMKKHAICAVVLAHTDPALVRRLLRSIEPAPVVLHCDATTPERVYREMLPAEGRQNLTLAPRRRTRLASWSLVAAELCSLQLAASLYEADHYLVMSGSDYPLVSSEQLRDELAGWRGFSRVGKTPVPAWFWGPDGGMDRFDHRWLTFRDNMVTWRGKHLALPIRAKVPPGLDLYASQQWKVLCREHVLAVVSGFLSSPDIVSFFRHSHVPEESAITSFISSPAYVGEDAAHRAVNAQPWLIHWGSLGAPHPDFLTMDHWNLIVTNRNYPPARPDDPEPVGTIEGDWRRLMARKFRSIEYTVLDRIDEELRR